MDVDEVVETSDIEEQEELLSLTSPARPVPVSITAFPHTPPYSPPRKRAKLFHPYTPSLSRPSPGPSVHFKTPVSSPSPSQHKPQNGVLLFNTLDANNEELPEVKEEELFSQRSSPDPLDSLRRLSESPRPRSPSSEAVFVPQMHLDRLFSEDNQALEPSVSSTPPPPPLPSSSPPTLAYTSSASPGLSYDPTHDDDDDFTIGMNVSTIPSTPNMSVTSPSRRTPSPDKEQSPSWSGGRSRSLGSPMQMSPARLPSPEPLSPPAPPPAPPPPPPPEPEVHDRGGYSLRKRNAAQIAPYTVERHQYRMTIRPCPEAEVNKGRPIRAPRDRSDRYEDDEDEEYQAPPEPEQRQKAARDMDEARPHLPEILQGLSEDENEDPEIRASRRAAKELQRKQRREQKEAERAARRQEERPLPKHRFPLPAKAREGRRGSDVIDLTDTSNKGNEGGATDWPSLPELMDHFGYDNIDAARMDIEEPTRAPSRPPDPPPKPPRKVHRRSRTPTPPPPDPNEELDPGELLRRHSPRKSRVLKHIVPRSMEKAFLLQGLQNRKANPPKRKPLPPSSDDEGTLLPGQTRTRISNQPKGAREIKGDSESELELNELSEPSSPVLRQPTLYEFNDFVWEDVGPRASGPMKPEESFQREEPRRQEVIEIPDHDDDESSADEGKDSNDLAGSDDFLVLLRPSAHVRAPERTPRESLIDYMTQRTQSSKSAARKRRRRRQQAASSSGPSTSYKFDIVTGGARGKEQQTLLSFANHKGGKRSAGSSKGYKQGGSGRTQASGRQPEVHVIESDSEPENDAALKRKLKKRERERRKKMHGIYVFVSGNQNHITTRYTRMGQRPDKLQEVLAPSAYPPPRPPWARTFPPPRQPRPFSETAVQIDLPRRGTDTETHEQEADSLPPNNDTRDKESDKSTIREVVADLGVRSVPKGRFFPDKTSIKRGLLQETVSLLKGTEEPIYPRPVFTMGLNLSPDGGIAAFIPLMERICDDIFNFVNDLPNVDEAQIELDWVTAIHSTFRVVSWLSKTLDDSSRLQLQDAVQRHTSQLLRRLVELDLEISKNSVLLAAWFCVGLAVRTHPPVPQASLHDSVSESSAFLIYNLLQTSFKSVWEMLKNKTPDALDPSFTLPAEMWVSIIHVLGTYADAHPNVPHPFWTQLLDVLSAEKASKNSTMASEYVWRLIFFLSALSQYSPLGMSKAEPHLRNGWSVVVYALGMVRLKALSTDNEVSSLVLEERDSYIHVILTRCFHLRERWGWTMRGANPLFKPLSEIFQSRRFGPLLHESKDRYPSFLSGKNWGLLASNEPEDTAYVLFLKLVAQAVADDPNRARDPKAQLPPPLSKVLSSAVPVTPIFPANATTLTDEEKAMFSNRIIAAAVSVYLNPSQYDLRFDQVRNYLKFSPDNRDACVITIDGMLVWAKVLVHSDVSIQNVAEWIEDMANSLSKKINEYPELRRPSITTDDSSVAKRTRQVINSLRSLIMAVSDILHEYMAMKTYPQPCLIRALHEVSSTWTFRGSAVLKNQMGILMDSAFRARTIALKARAAAATPPVAPRPPPQPPSAPAADIESQEFDDLDDYGDFNWDDPSLLQALEGQPSASHELDEEFGQAMQFFKNYPFRFLVESANPPYEHNPHDIGDGQADMWLGSWLGMQTLNLDKKKQGTVDLQPKTLFRLICSAKARTEARRNWHLRLKVNLMLHLLRIDRKYYDTSNDLCVKRALQALALECATWAKDYLALFLSLGGSQHALFKEAEAHFPPRDACGDFQFETNPAFLAVRLDIVQAILRKINLALGSNGDDLDGYSKDKYVTACITLLKVMRRTLAEHASLPPGTRETGAYNQFCLDVARFFSTLRNVSTQTRLAFWKGWANTLLSTADRDQE